MKTVKFILITIIIITIIAGIPFFVLKAGNDSNHLVSVEGSDFQGPIAYTMKVLEDKDVAWEVKENVINMNKEYSNLIREEKEDVLNLFFATSLILGISIITFGIIFLNITKYKIFSSALITSGVLSTIFYILMYVVTLSIWV